MTLVWHFPLRPQMSRNVGKPMFWILTRSDTNQAVQPPEMARGLKFCIEEVEVFYYPSSENKGTDQLRGFCEADLCLCFHICKTLVFSWRGSNHWSETRHLITVKFSKIGNVLVIFSAVLIRLNFTLFATIIFLKTWVHVLLDWWCPVNCKWHHTYRYNFSTTWILYPNESSFWTRPGQKNEDPVCNIEVLFFSKMS